MAERTSRVRLYEDELQRLHDYRSRNYDRPEDIPLGAVIDDLIEDAEQHARSQSKPVTFTSENL